VAADRTINLSDSPDNTGSSTGMVATAAAPSATGAVDPRGRPKAIELVDVGHEYASGTPWAKTALHDINSVVEQGDGVLIHGGNGSGKSTLAWIMAGLTIPTTGACLIDGERSNEHVGAVALSFQAARLQLMRSRVRPGSGFGSWLFASRGRSRGRGAGRGRAGTLRWATDASTSSAVARCVGLVLAGLLARSPRALILDEPLAGLDGCQPAQPAASARTAAPRAGPDVGGHLARLRRAGRGFARGPCICKAACWKR